ncbi:YadA-like family protein [Burkholderia cenocepacia]|uniref:YadA-like family protein n=1 Tax=Burkholderia cenocepacia TaxID=95486 RepID=UPI0021AB10AC|nr:YadA-like family protein [Burkholderia cenocepacia]
MDEACPFFFSSTEAINVNKTYRTVWNATTGTWAAAPETARMRTKSKANSTMKSSVTAAVAVMAGVGGGAMSMDSMAQAANGGGSLALCAPGTGATGTTFGGGNIAGTRTTAACGGAIQNFRLSEGHERSFQLYNNSNVNGGGIGQASAATEAGISGTVDGHLFLLGGSGVHLRGPVDFDSNASMTNHRITNLANGTAGTDAVNLNQLNAAVATAGNPYVAVSTGNYATATAAVATAGNSATAVGGNARATGISAVAIGGNTVASNQNATALGTLATVTGNESVAVGSSARATAGNTTVVGQAANASIANSIAIGTGASVQGFGVPNASGSIAIGNGTTAGGSSSTVIGTNASHSGSGATVLGAGASAMGGGAGVAMGLTSSASGSAAVALGTNTTASGANSVALGTGSVANAVNTVSVGSTGSERRITNLAAGTANTDAVNLGQLNSAIANVAPNPYVAVRGSTAASATGSRSIAIGDGAIARNTANGGQTNIAIGAGANTAGGFGQIAFGEGASTQNSAAGGSIAIGRNATTTQRGLAIGDGASATATYGIALGDGSLADRENALSIGRAGAERQIVNVAAGTAATDAVNVSQLTGVTNALGGNARVGADGSIVQPTYNVAGTDYHNVGDALDALAANGGADPNAVRYDDATKGAVTLGGAGATTPVALKNVADAKDDHDALNLGQLKNAGLVGDDGSGNLTSLAVTYDDATKNAVTLGNAGAPVAIHNVADGVLSATSKDAVNGSQLFATNTRVGNLEDSLGKGGVIDPVTGESLAVVYDGTVKDKVTLAGADGTTLSNVRAGVDDKDAVNVGQLKGSGLIGDDGKSIAAVTYDRNVDGTPNYGAVTLGNGAGLTQVKNVADATDDHDALNLGQLKNAGLVGDDGAGNLTSLAVTYDSTAKDKVTLAGADGTTLANVKAGVADMDAVNVGQMNTALSTKLDNKLVKVDGDVAASTVGEHSIAIGSGASADNRNDPTGIGIGSIAVGDQAQADGANSVAVGARAYANTIGSAFGTAASASGAGASAIGYGTDASGRFASAIGSLASASGENSVALGANSVADRDNTVSVGSGTRQRQIVNVAAGTQDTDAINVGQLKDSGLIGDDGKSIAAVTYDRNLDGTPNYGSVTLGNGAGPTQVKNVADATDDHDALNLGQLKNAGLVGDDGSGNLTSLAVTYDDATKQAVTLGNAGTPVALHNVAAGALSETSTDAVNGSQLFATNTRVGNLEDSLKDGGVIDPVTGESLAVVYDGTAKDTVTLKGTDGTTLSNVKAGVADMDAVNVSQLKDSGLIGDDGKAIAAVTYDRNPDGTPNYGTVTLGNGAGPTKIKNVAAGVDGTDAVNVNQMNTGLSDLEDRLKGADLRFVKVNADPVTGTPALATGALAVAIGSGAQAAGANALALGSGARVSGAGSVAIGYNSVANQNNVVSVGSVGNERRIVNVADGDVSFQSTDAVNGGQLYAALNDLSTSVSSKTQQAIDSFSSAIDEKTKAAIDEMNAQSIKPMDVTDPLVAIEGVRGDNLASLNGADPTKATAAAIGSSTVASGANAVAVGLQSGALSDNSVAIGSFAQTGAGQPYSVAMGSNVQTNGTQAVAMGANAQANADYALAVGNNNVQAIGDSSIALGNGANVRAGATNSIAMGTGANIARNVQGAMALGSGATATTNGGIALGDNALANRANALSIGRAGAERQIVNVAAGTQNTDAVNVGQLKGVTNALGGGAGVGADGSVTQPTYSVGGKDYNNVGDALGAIAASGGDPDAVKYDDGTHQAITLGNAGTPVAIHNVAEGALTATSTDAVNGSQLFATNQSIGDLRDSLRDGGVIDPVTGESLAVVYDGAAKDKVTLKGADGTTLANVKAGVADMDAVNVSQLKDSGLIGDDGKAIAAVTYDDATKGSVTLGGTGATTPVALKNVADAKDDHDALNLGQLKDAGLVGDDGSGNLTSMAVTYDGTARDKVTLQGADGTTLANVKAGVADMDAVNVSQLKDSGLIGDDGKAIAAVTYDDATKTAVTLGNAGTPVAIHNVAAGALSATSTDAVNGSQLFATNTRVGDLEDSLGRGGVIDPVTGESLAVVYDGTAKDTVTLKGADGTTLANVKAGVADMDAVNVSQLKGSGLIGDDGKAIAAVTYDRLPDGTPNFGSVTLGNGAGPTQLKNVAAATDNTDAVNFGQMKDYVGDHLGDPSLPGNPLAVAYDDGSKGQVTLAGGADGTTITNVKAGAVTATSTDAINGAQLHGTAQSVADSLGGGSTVDADGKVTNPTYSLVDPADGSTKTEYHNVGDALANLDGRTATNTENITVINKQLGDSGLIDPVTGQTLAAVTYDRNADGTPNRGSVTLGGADATAPVALKNVADGTDRHDAINIGQLQDAGLVAPVDPADPGAGLKSLAVTYDGVAQDKVTLKGADGTTLANVKAGVADMDAVNVSQLKGSGLIGDDGKAIAAVTYDRLPDGTPDYGKVTLGNGEGPTQIKNVANATDDGDALNLGQLKEAGLVGDDGSGNLTSLAVTYDDAAKNAITLGGTGATTPVAIHNVADGVLSATSHDAVNGSQLFATNTRVGNLEDSLGRGGVIDPITGESLAVVYDGTAKDKVTLQGADGTTLANVKAGAADMDAVNVRQLKDSGLIGDDGKAIAAVTYDDATKSTVTLGGAGSTTPVTLKNVADGVDRHDAINLGQLQDAGLVAPVDPTNPGAGLTSTAVTYDKHADGSVNFDQITLKGGADGTKLSNVAAGEVSATSKDAINGAQLHGTAQSMADSLGGGSKVDADGKVTNPTYSLVDPADGSTKTEYHNVGDALANLDGRTATNTENITVINKQMGDSGLIDPATGQTLAAVTYDRNADGTPNRGSVTLGGADATAPVALKNVADGVEAHDAVNLGQLQSAGIVAPVDPENPGKGLKSLAVTYDGVAQDKVTLKGADGTTLTNVKAGAVTATSTDAVNGSQLHGTAQSVADSLGGRSTVDADGKVTNPTYSLADPTNGSTKTEYHNVGDALANLDDRTSTNTGNITVINKQLSDSGLVDPATGQALAAVTYDRNADGTPNRGSVTLGGADATTPVALKNVAAGVDRHDAINLGQLQDAGLVAPVDPTNPGAGLTSLAVAYDNVAKDKVTLAGADGTTITNVKAGAVSATSTDAINGSQLYGASQSVAKALGGGATVDANGNVTNPTYTVNNEKFDNVGDALENISSSLVHGSIGLVQQDETTRDITVAKDTDGTTVNFAGTAGDRVLTGVGAGVVSATSNDAINGSQLHGTAQSVADTIGGGTTVDANGKLADTSIEVNGSKYKTVAEAVQAAAAYGATDSLAVRYDLNRDGTPNYGSVTLGGTGAAPVRLTNVADGTTQYDAVNFGQLSELSDRLGGVDDRVGRLEQNPGGGNPSPTPGSNDYFAGTDVGTGTTPASAGTGVGNTAAGSGAVVGTGVNNGTVVGSNANVSASNGTAIGTGSKSSAEGATAIGNNANASGSKSAAIGDGASASGSNSVALGAGSMATSDNTVSVGSATQQRTISNLADGVNATDAATKGQLDRAMGGMQGQMNELSRNAYSGIAAATALTMIPGVDPGKTLSFGIGGATFQGYQAVAFGGEARITQNLKMKAGVGLSSGGNTVGVGASYQW